MSVVVATAAGALAARRARKGRAVTCEAVFHIYLLAGQQVVALQGADLTVEHGEAVALLGPSGSGKSTLLSILGGLERPSAGRVLLDGHDLARLPESELTALRRRRVGFVWQVPARNLLPYATVAENLDFPMTLAGLPALRRRRRARVLLEAVGLGASVGKPVRALSGGEQQRLAVAVGLANNPSLLLADEPTSQLDRENADAVLAVLKEARQDLGTTVVLVTHDPAAARAMDRTLTIRDGRVGAEGRGGTEYALIGPTGSVHLPEDALEVLAPGSRAVVEVGQGTVVLRAADLPNGVVPTREAAPADPRRLPARRAAGGPVAPVLAGTELVARRGGRPVVDGVSVGAGPGELVGLVGPSGSGKTTVLGLLAGLEAPDAGVVRFEGEDLAALGEARRRALRRERLGIVFQGYGLLTLLSAQENVELPHRIAGREPRAAADEAARWLALLGLSQRAGHRVDELSGGEQQRVALARALASGADVLLVDEPTAELDEASRDRVIGLLVDAADRGLTVVTATHDPDVVEACTRVLRLADGRPAPPPAA